MYKKALYIIVDALRYDTLSDKDSSSYLFPTMSKLVNDGFLKKVVTNAQSTQFVLPSLFSLTYPLDYGGYNSGIRERPASYVECIKKNKIKTLLMACCNQMGVGMGYDRGFDEVLTTMDFRLLIEQKISRNLLYEVELYKNNQQSKKEMINIISKEFSIALENISNIITNQNQTLWPSKLKRMNNAIAKNCIEELKILKDEPEIIVKKIWTVPAGAYWCTLGKKKYFSLNYVYVRIYSAFNWRLHNLVSSQNFWPFLILGHYQVVFGDILNSLVNKILELKKESWLMHLHVMDVHDCRAINHLLKIIGRLSYFPKWFVARISGKTKRKFVYDSSVMYVDRCLEKLFNRMKREGIFSDTLILITADHGSAYAESPRKKADVGERTHYEDIEVPLIILNGKQKPLDNQLLCDTMGVTASFLDELGVKLDESFKGISVFKGGRKAVISESCGRGNSDILRKDIYFTVTTKEYKMMAVLKGNKLCVEKLFSLINDPRELVNIINKTESKNIIKVLTEYLYNERAHIFDMRNVAI